MFGELPKLFDRNFVVGFFLPSTIFYALLLFIAHQFNAVDLAVVLQQNSLEFTSFIGLISWFTGVLLLVTNRDLYRFLEGYGKYNPLNLLGWIERKRYDDMVKELNYLDGQYIKCMEEKTELPMEKLERRNTLMQEMSTRFPDDKRWLLPTAFGNTLRSFEVYPRVMYGIEGVDGWSRLVAVIPEKYLSLVDDAKAQVDFWVNLGGLCFLLAVEYFILAYQLQSLDGYWLLILVLGLMHLASYRARRGAVGWGDLVKSAFDVYRFDLFEAMHFEYPTTRGKEKELWLNYSQSIVYRLPSQLPRLSKTKKKNTSK